MKPGVVTERKPPSLTARTVRGISPQRSGSSWSASCQPSPTRQAPLSIGTGWPFGARIVLYDWLVR